MEEKKLVEDRINYYFSSRWTREEISFFTDENPQFLDISALRANLGSPIRDFVLRGGKRLRPFLFFQTLGIFGVNYKKYVDLGVLLELVHNATLILDDIEDRAMERRGKPTTHLTFGLDTATNTGMALHILPLNIINKYSDVISPETKTRLFEIYTEELSNLSMGQALDIYWHKQQKNHITQQKYLSMVRLKTGSLFRMAVRFAVAIAGQDAKVEEDFSRFAGDIGVSFQIMDDVLDLSATSEKFGKSYGNDITEGKMSLPVLCTMSMAKTDEVNRLQAILSKHTRNRTLISEALKIIHESGGLGVAEKQAERIVDRSFGLLTDRYSNFDLKPLEKIALFFVKRDH